MKNNNIPFYSPSSSKMINIMDPPYENNSTLLSSVMPLPLTFMNDEPEKRFETKDNNTLFNMCSDIHFIKKEEQQQRYPKQTLNHNNITSPPSSSLQSNSFLQKNFKETCCYSCKHPSSSSSSFPLPINMSSGSCHIEMIEHNDTNIMKCRHHGINKKDTFLTEAYDFETRQQQQQQSMNSQSLLIDPDYVISLNDCRQNELNHQYTNTTTLTTPLLLPSQMSDCSTVVPTSPSGYITDEYLNSENHEVSNKKEWNQVPHVTTFQQQQESSTMIHMKNFLYILIEEIQRRRKTEFNDYNTLSQVQEDFVQCLYNSNKMDISKLSNQELQLLIQSCSVALKNTSLNNNNNESIQDNKYSYRNNDLNNNHEGINQQEDIKIKDENTQETLPFLNLKNCNETIENSITTTSSHSSSFEELQNHHHPNDDMNLFLTSSSLTQQHCCNKDILNSNLPTRRQFLRTKICPYQLKGYCANQNTCSYAHCEGELQPLPDLHKTKLCEMAKKGLLCRKPLCSYAHSINELKPSPDLITYKTAPCFFWKRSKCFNGTKCRFAHGDNELRQRIIIPEYAPVLNEILDNNNNILQKTIKDPIPSNFPLLSESSIQEEQCKKKVKNEQQKLYSSKNQTLLKKNDIHSYKALQELLNNNKLLLTPANNNPAFQFLYAAANFQKCLHNNNTEQKNALYQTLLKKLYEYSQGKIFLELNNGDNLVNLLSNYLNEISQLQ